MEKILEINEVEDVKVDGEYGSYDGYEVVTDKQKIRLLIDNGQNCCEDWGYFISEDDLEDFIDSNLLEIKLTDTALNTEKYKESIGYGLDDGDVMFVDLVTDNGSLQFAAYNVHNGYYGHEALVVSEQFNHSEYL